VLALAASAWLCTGPLREQARWLQVEAPRHAVAGGPVPIRVTLRAPSPAVWLSVDLHGMSSRHEPRGFVSQGGSQRIDARARSYLFEVPVAAESDLGYVLAVVYLSSSGRWEDRIAAAATEPIALRSEGPGELQPISAYDLTKPIGTTRAPSPTLRVTIAALWLLAGLVLWWRTRSASPPAGAAAAVRRSGWLALACIAAGLWELSNAESWVVAVARTLAWEHRLYYERSALQELITIAILLAATALAAARLRAAGARGPERPLHAVLWLYAGLSLISSLSWHEADQLLAAPVLSVPVVQIAKLATAIAALLAGMRRP